MSLSNGKEKCGMSSHKEEWSDTANRYRNIFTAIDNLLTQLGTNAQSDELYRRLEYARDVYRHEMLWHRYQSLCCQCRILYDLGLVRLDDERRNA